MFDIYGVIDFHKRFSVTNIKNPYLRYKYYSDIPFEEYSFQNKNAKIFYLERHKTAENYYCDNGEHLFILGHVFSNKNYESLEGHRPKKLSACEVHCFYKRFEKELVRYIKGSFVLIIYNEKDNSLLCISDHLNVFPIFYTYKDGIFIFSSAIKPILDSGLISHAVNKAAIVEFALFDYTLGSKTFFKNIAMLDYGMILTVNENGIQKERYFEIHSFFQKELMNEHDSLVALIELLHENVNLYASDSKKFLLSLTGGFDGRANLALIDRPVEDFLCYSYAMPGSRQISVPTEIAQRVGIDYRPVYLDADFEDQYEDCALRALFYSDGRAPLLRANYPYAYQKLREFAETAITGLFGSEILRPIRNLGGQINDNSERLFMSDNVDKELKSIFEFEKNRGYLKPEVFEECYDEMREYVREHYFTPFKDVGKLTRFFIFFIEEGVRKYFMQEIRIERVLVNTRFPYFDFDLLSLIYKTPFAGLYNGALRESPIGRRKAQLLYVHAINQYKPILGEIINDRGYKPKDLLSPFFFIKILPGYVRTKLYKRRISDDAFNSERWTDLVFSKNIELMKKETDIFSSTLITKYENNESVQDNYRFSRIFSLKFWFERMQ